ncbi:hypothetical protein ACWGB8_03000 [Kitasatospora sp. NPDC054939]
MTTLHLPPRPLDVTVPRLPPPPRRAVRAARAVTLLALPSGLWRLLLAAVTVSYHRRHRAA